MSADLVKLIKQHAYAAGLDPLLVVAVAQQESSLAWPMASSRFEPGIKTFDNPEYFAKMNGISKDTECAEQATSWGPLHILGRTARMLKYSGPLPMLFQPEVSVPLACKYLAKLQNEHETDAAMIAAYNAGSPRVKDGKFINQSYVDAVLSKMQRLKRERAQITN